jgi:hypothetical protein
MLRQIAKAFRFLDAVIVAPASFVAIAAPQAIGELREQNFMDKIAAKRNFVRLVCLALGAALCLRVVWG